MAMEKAIGYVILLNVEPKEGKKLSEAQFTSLCKEFQDLNMDEVKRSITELFHEESEQNKKWADSINREKPINRDEQTRMINRTHEIADRYIKAYERLDQVKHALKKFSYARIP